MSIPPLLAADAAETAIESLGNRTVDSPLCHGHFVGDDSQITYDEASHVVGMSDGELRKVGYV